jgi:phosphate transport system protein
MSERVVRHFEEELQQLQARLLAMGGLAEDRVRAAIESLVTRNLSSVDAVLAGDEPINQLHLEIDNRCFTLLALHQPMAVDLRAIVSAAKINTDLERVGDLAVNIAEATARYLTHPPVKELTDIPRMARIAQAMLRDALDAFVRRDMAAATSSSTRTTSWTR